MLLAAILNERLTGPQAKIAARLGVSQTTVSAWKRGASLPPRTRLPGLAKALGIPLARLAAIVASDRLDRINRTAGQVPAEGDLCD
jgi:transcriptional regulator with XRE-family HTH domain